MYTYAHINSHVLIYEIHREIWTLLVIWWYKYIVIGLVKYDIMVMFSKISFDTEYLHMKLHATWDLLQINLETKRESEWGIKQK